MHGDPVLTNEWGEDTGTEGVGSPDPWAKLFELQELQYTRLRALGWPEALIKAASDEFTYMAGLVDGRVLVFESAKPSADGLWAHLTEAGFVSDIDRAQEVADYPRMFPRGVDIRVSSVLWVADAPFGS